MRSGPTGPCKVFACLWVSLFIRIKRFCEFSPLFESPSVQKRFASGLLGAVWHILGSYDSENRSITTETTTLQLLCSLYCFEI